MVAAGRIWPKTSACTAVTSRHTRCLLDGFDEILALAGDPAPRATPASFVVGRDGDDMLETIARDAS
jgi:5,10-methylenetetrahydrofolate reductase